MRMQVILDSLFARPGSAPLLGWKKGEFRDWTSSRVNFLFRCRCDWQNIVFVFSKKTKFSDDRSRLAIWRRFGYSASSFDKDIFHFMDSELFLHKVGQNRLRAFQKYSSVTSKKFKLFLRLWPWSLITRSLSILISFNRESFVFNYPDSKIGESWFIDNNNCRPGFIVALFNLRIFHA